MRLQYFPPPFVYIAVSDLGISDCQFRIADWQSRWRMAATSESLAFDRGVRLMLEIVLREKADAVIGLGFRIANFGLRISRARSEEPRARPNSAAEVRSR